MAKINNQLLNYLLIITLIKDSHQVMNSKQSNQQDIMYSECGQTKNCFGFPDGCISGRRCEFMTKISGLDKKFTFELMSVNVEAIWVATGLSNDNIMGNDFNIECVLQNGIGTTYASWSTPKPNLSAVRGMAEQNILVRKEALYLDGFLYCSVETDAIFTVQNQAFNLVNNSYHLLIASGSTLRDTELVRHNIGKQSSANSIHLLQIYSEIRAASKPILLILHAGFMIIAWIVTSTVGMLLARYFKKDWVGIQIRGKDQWFAWHVILMSITWILHMTAFILIFIHVGQWSAADNPHAILGLCSTIFCFFQPIGGFLRPSLEAPHRKYFNIGHFLGGNIAHIFAIATMYFAVTLIGINESFYWLLSFFLMLYVVMHILFLGINTVNIQIQNEKLPDTKHRTWTRIKKLLFVTYILMATGLAVGLIIYAIQ